jgi:hypothetical protein
MKFTLAWLKEHRDTDAPHKHSAAITLTVVLPPPLRGRPVRRRRTVTAQ